MVEVDFSREREFQKKPYLINCIHIWLRYYTKFDSICNLRTSLWDFTQGASGWHPNLFRIIWPPPPLSTFGTDLYYRLHATSLTTFPWPPSPSSDADIISGNPLNMRHEAMLKRYLKLVISVEGGQRGDFHQQMYLRIFVHDMVPIGRNFNILRVICISRLRHRKVFFNTGWWAKARRRAMSFRNEERDGRKDSRTDALNAADGRGHGRADGLDRQMQVFCFSSKGTTGGCFWDKQHL